MPTGKRIHVLSNIDYERYLADCANCGPGVEIYIRENGQRARCVSGSKESGRKAYAKLVAAKPPKKPKFNRSDYNYRYIYGLVNVPAMKEELGCYVCGEKDIAKLHVDHCHDTNRVRGILCSNHNTGLGLYQDNPEFLARAIEYLQNPIEIPQRYLASTE